MKNYIKFIGFIAIIVIATIFSSCHKDNKPVTDQSGKQYKVAVHVGFDVSVSNFSAVRSVNALNTNTVVSPDTLGSHLSVLHYHVYTSGGGEIRNGTQQSTDPNFGNISFTVPNGAYFIIVDGGESGFQETPLNNYFVMEYSYTNNNEYPVTSLSPFKANTFWSNQVDFTVNNSATIASISLDRIVAQLKIVIQDAIPSNVKSITAIVNNDAYGIYASSPTTTPVSATAKYYYNVTPVVTGNTNTTIIAYVGQTQIPISVELISTTNAVTDLSKLKTYTVVADKVISSVAFKANATTVLAGHLFDGNGQGFTITYDPKWGGTSKVGF